MNKYFNFKMNPKINKYIGLRVQSYDPSSLASFGSLFFRLEGRVIEHGGLLRVFSFTCPIKGSGHGSWGLIPRHT